MSMYFGTEQNFQNRWKSYNKRWPTTNGFRQLSYQMFWKPIFCFMHCLLIF